MPRKGLSKRSRGTIAVDFDLVLRATDGSLVDGADIGVRSLFNQGWKLIVFTCRRDLDYVTAWLDEQKLLRYFIAATFEKPRADFYLDDKGVRFTDWPEANAFFLRAHGA